MSSSIVTSIIIFASLESKLIACALRASWSKLS